MKCRELLEFLMQYLEDELPPEERASFERHMDDCPPCANYIQSYRAVRAMGRKALCCEGDAVPADVPEDLIQAILRARQEGRAG